MVSWLAIASGEAGAFGVVGADAAEEEDAEGGWLEEAVVNVGEWVASKEEEEGVRVELIWRLFGN